jgi:hypothetical protein
MGWGCVDAVDVRAAVFESCWCDGGNFTGCDAGDFNEGWS